LKEKEETMTVKPGLEKEWREAREKNTKDGYSAQVVKVTELCCDALDEGLSPNDACDKAVKNSGITGFMAGCMAQWVSYFHPRGEEFRKWWNIDNQIRDEGEKANKGKGTLNPALISIQTKQ